MIEMLDCDQLKASVLSVDCGCYRWWPTSTPTPASYPATEAFWVFCLDSTPL